MIPALLRSLTTDSESVVKRVLELLTEMSRFEPYFIELILELLTLFANDITLLDNRGSLILRQLCSHMNSERIFKLVAETLEKESNINFTQRIIQQMNNSLLTAYFTNGSNQLMNRPELGDTRKKLRQLQSLEGSAFFTTLYKSWCFNSIDTISLCLV